MPLPPELINRVLGYLSDDSESLRAMSLVSKAWASWCQVYLFKSIHLTPPALKGWLENISPEVDGPASHTRALTLEEYRLIPWINPQGLRFPLSNLASFSGVKSLSFLYWDATLLNGMSLEPYFSHFGKSLCVLSLQFCKLDPAVFFDLLSLLPNVDDLEITYPLPHPCAQSTVLGPPEITPNFRGSLSLVDLNTGHLILGALATLPLHFSTIRIKGCTFYEQGAYQLMLTKCRDTLVTLRFEESYRDRPLPDVSLESCNELQEVHVFLHSFMKIPRSLEILFPSISSQKLRKISLSSMEFVEDEEEEDGDIDENGDDEEDEDDEEEEDGDTDEDGDGDEDEDDEDRSEDEWSAQRARTIPWGSWDTILSPLAHQAHNAEGKLILQLNVRRASQKPFEPDHLLPKFSGHGGLINVNYIQSVTDIP